MIFEFSVKISVLCLIAFHQYKAQDLLKANSFFFRIDQNKSVERGRNLIEGYHSQLHCATLLLHEKPPLHPSPFAATRIGLVVCVVQSICASGGGLQNTGSDGLDACLVADGIGAHAGNGPAAHCAVSPAGHYQHGRNL